MRLRILIVSGMLLGVILLSSCLSSSITINIDVSCEDFEARSNTIGNEFEIEVNDKIRAKLCANPSTGFTWLASIDDENGVIQLEKQEYIAPDTELAGASGMDDPQTGRTIPPRPLERLYHVSEPSASPGVPQAACKEVRRGIRSRCVQGRRHVYLPPVLQSRPRPSGPRPVITRFPQGFPKPDKATS